MFDPTPILYFSILAVVGLIFAMLVINYGEQKINQFATDEEKYELAMKAPEITPENTGAIIDAEINHLCGNGPAVPALQRRRELYVVVEPRN